MKKLLCFGLVLISTVCAFAQVTNTAKVSLAWDGNCNPEVNGYRVYYTTNKLNPAFTNVTTAYIDDCGTNRPASTNLYLGNYSTNFVTVEGRTNTTATVTNLTRGSTYYFIVRSKNAILESDNSILESDNSNEVEFTVPLNPTNSPPTKPEGFHIMSVN